MLGNAYKVALGLLNLVAPPPLPGGQSDRAPSADLPRHFSNSQLQSFSGRSVIDFGCGHGREAVAVALLGAHRVIGIEIQAARRASAMAFAEEQRVQDRCIFVESTNEQADIIVSKDAFEHFSDLPAVLREMARLLKAGGVVYASFGPTWLHPYGGHLFSVFPWAHLIVPEAALIAWRNQFKNDGATRLEDVEGGLNRLRIIQFERYVADSPFVIESLELVPIRGWRFLTWRPWREFGTSLVRCTLRRRS